MTLTIWHNPRCSKSRAALALLLDREADPVVRRYLDDAPSETEIAQALKALGLPARDLVRWGEQIVRDLGLTRDMEDSVLIAAMAAHPILIERPVVLGQGSARIGRPPEAVLDLL